MRVAIDEQIFVAQRFGGISRMFVSLMEEFRGHPELGVELQPMANRVVNHYLLDSTALAADLRVREAASTWTALGGYLATPRPRARVDVVHNTFYLPHGLAGYPGARRVVTIHDMIPELMPRTRRRLDFITLKRAYVDRADHVICVSEATRRDLESVYGTPKAPVSVIHHGVDPRFRPGAEPLAAFPDEYVLFVGNRTQYKDVDTLYRAFSALSGRYPHLSLVLVGGGALRSSERAALRKLGIEDRVSQHALADAELAAAYANATVFVFPSQHEGFGLPVLEAMASGVPSVLAQATSLPEVGGDAAAYFTPGSSDELTDVLVALLDDGSRRAELAAHGIARAAQFTWQDAAARTAKVYADVLG
jgi:glycosyltransferase involved in cell wall biosynthesis